MPTRYAIQLAYDGTDFCGWQQQPGRGRHSNPLPSIEGTVTTAIESVCGESRGVTASGRTDSGVHASGQVAHFTLTNRYHNEDRFLDALNGALPDAIRIHHLSEVPPTFSARNAVEKQYSYYYQQGPARLPHLRRFSMWDRYSLDAALMQAAADCLVGEHDFQTFASSSPGVTTTVRRITEVEIARSPVPAPGDFDPDACGLIRFRIRGTGFLKQMVRSLAGTLKQVGEKRRSVDDFVSALEGKDRNLSGPVAPANGLWLDRVWYDSPGGVPFLDQDGR